MGTANTSPEYLCSGRDNQLILEFKMTNELNDQRRYDYLVVGAGAAGSVLAAELSASGAQVLVIESGGRDDAPTIANPSICFTTWLGRSITTVVKIAVQRDAVERGLSPR